MIFKEILIKVRKSRFIRWINERLVYILQELNISSSLSKPEHWISGIVNSMKFLLLFTVAYAIVRTLLLKTIFADKEITAFLENLYHASIYELVFIACATGLLFVTLVRTVVTVRFSPKAMVTCVMIYALYLIEKDYGQFTFLPSKLLGINYFEIIILPPATEIILRIGYILFRKSLTNASSFIENQPLEDDAEDKTTRGPIISNLALHLNKANFLGSYSIGVVGEWGTGKTSFIKSLEKKVNRKTIIIHFNPWLSTGRTSLVHEFIESLKFELNKFDKGLGFSLDKYLDSLIEVEKNTKSNISRTVARVFATENSSNVEFAEVKKAIQRTGKRLIIFIDDFDRLDKNEIVDVLKLIRNTGNFPNTTYVSCYDKLYLIHALQNFNKRNLGILLDKFFDYEITLPPIQHDRILEFLRDNFFDDLDVSGPIRNEALDTIREGYLLQFREVKKLVTSLKLSYELYGNGLYLHDFVLVEILRVKYPFLPSIMWQRRKSFFNQSPPPSNIMLLREEGSKEVVLENFLIGYEGEESTRQFLTSEDIKIIVEILKKLFTGKPFGHPLAIQEPSFFDNYFYYNLPDVSVKELSWHRVIQSGEYDAIEIFKEKKFDTKKELLIRDAVFANTVALKTAVNNDPVPLFKFLLYLIDWSDGLISMNLFDEAYKHFPQARKAENFYDLLLSEPSVPTHFVARSRFVATLIRAFIYSEAESNLDFITLDGLKKVNQLIFRSYLERIEVFSNDSMSIFFHQINSIVNNKVEVSEEAALTLRTFIEMHPREFLDLNIRSAMHPNTELQFVFAPFTISSLFVGKEQFRQFIIESDYPEFKKAKLVEYLTNAELNDYQTYQFDISKDDLKVMPLEFTNAWSNIPNAILQDIKVISQQIEFTLFNQIPATNNPDENDHVFNNLFEVRDSIFQIEVAPINSPFWRFGFKFYETKISQKRRVQRHGLESEIFIVVGSRDSSNNWVEQNKLDLASRNLKEMSDKTPFRAATNYTSDEHVKILVTFSTARQSYRASVHILAGDRSLGSKTFDLGPNKYFELAGWADSREFRLETIVRRNVQLF